MIDKLEIPLQELEQLEFKYGVRLHVDQFEDETKPDAYFLMDKSGSFIYIGSTLSNVKEKLKSWYGY